MFGRTLQQEKVLLSFIDLLAGQFCIIGIDERRQRSYFNRHISLNPRYFKYKRYLERCYG